MFADELRKKSREKWYESINIMLEQNKKAFNERYGTLITAIDNQLDNAADDGDFEICLRRLNDSYSCYMIGVERFDMPNKIYREIKRYYKGLGFKVRRNPIFKNIIISWWE